MACQQLTAASLKNGNSKKAISEKWQPPGVIILKKWLIHAMAIYQPRCGDGAKASMKDQNWRIGKKNES